MLELAVSYTPAGTDFAVTLATVRDVSLLVSVLRIAVRQARAEARAAKPMARAGFERQAEYLERYLAGLTSEQLMPTAVM